MSVVLITGSTGLIGSEAATFFAGLGLNVVGIDNDMQCFSFDEEASTPWHRQRLKQLLGKKYRYVETDLRDQEAIAKLFKHYGSAIELVIHTAAQPINAWGAQNPILDFTVNANGTLNLLEATRQYALEAVFIFASTNQVYGDTPNHLPLEELEQRWEIVPGHTYEQGIREDMSIDQTLHSLLGVSKVAADVLVQEYGRYFGIRTACFRSGCLTSFNHSVRQLHGFLAYLMRCTVMGNSYTVYGYKGKQVRDNIHISDLIQAFYHFFTAPRVAEVYNIGGGRYSNCSILEAIRLCQEITGNELNWSYCETHGKGDRIWWISDNSKFMHHYPNWQLQYDLLAMLYGIYDVI